MWKLKASGVIYAIRTARDLTIYTIVSYSNKQTVLINDFKYNT